MAKNFQQSSARRVVITGGTGSLGEKLVRSFIESGDEVIFTYLRSDEKAQKLLDQLSSHSVYACTLDTNSSDSIDQLIQFISSRWDDVDVLINNAGVHSDKLLALMSDEQWSSVLNTNVTGVFKLTKSLLPLMLGGEDRRIINISSVASTLGLVGQSNYAASKAALEAMSRVLSKEIAKHGVTVNCVSPGFLEEGMTGSIDQKLKDHYLDLVPLNRFGKTKEVVSVVRFLASSESSYITGATIPVSGGL